MAIIAGYQSKLAISDADPPDKQLDFVRLDFGAAEDLIDANAMRGTRSRSLERVRIGLRRVGGSIVFWPTPVELFDVLLQWILGGTPSGNTFPLGNTLPEKIVTIDRVGWVQKSLGCVVNRATIRGRTGQPVEVELDVMGKDEALGAAGTFPSLTPDTTTKVFVFHDSSISINSTTYQLKDFEFTIDNRVDGERFLNSQTRTQLFSMDRVISLSAMIPWGDAYNLYSLAGTDGFAFSATWSFNNCSLVLSCPKLFFMRKPIGIPGREELFYPFQAQALSTAANNELTVTCDKVP